jgi:hypothetical protein
MKKLDFLRPWPKIKNIRIEWTEEKQKTSIQLLFKGNERWN